MASARYRAAIPAQATGATLNDPDADCLIFAKPCADDLLVAQRGRERGATVIMDWCDAHLWRRAYRDLSALAHRTTACTPWMAQLLTEDLGVPSVTVIPDPYELEEEPPHTTDAGRLFWFGHASNYEGLQRVRGLLDGFDLRVMSNVAGAIPWSMEGLREELRRADVVVLPETAPYKSANRAVEAIRMGCFVVAEPHPSLEAIPGIWVGSLREGVQWAQQHPQQCREQLTQSQAFVREQYSPAHVANAWKTLWTELRSSWDVGISHGTGGPTSMGHEPPPTPISSQTCGRYRLSPA